MDFQDSSNQMRGKTQRNKRAAGDHYSNDKRAREIWHLFMYGFEDLFLRHKSFLKLLLMRESMIMFLFMPNREHYDNDSWKPLSSFLYL